MRYFKSNFVKSVSFILIFILIHGIIDHFYIPWLRSSNSYEITRRQFEESNDRICILVVGDSHAKFDVNPEYFTGLFNFAFNGENYIQTYFKIRHYLDEGKLNSDLVIIPIDLHSFSSFRTNSIGDTAFWKRYMDFFELGIQKGDLYHYLRLWLQGEFSYLGGMDEVIKKIVIEDDADFSEIVQGFFVLEREYEKSTDEFIITSAQNSTSYHFKGQTLLDKDLITYFLKLIDLLESHGISILYVWYLITHEYYSEASKYVPADDFFNQVVELIPGDSGSKPILDYHDLYWGQNHLFYNAGHLNSTGADLFSQRLHTDIANLFPDLDCNENP